MIGLVIFACVSLLVGFLWWVDRDRRHHGELPKAADYTPPSNVGRVWPDTDAWLKEQAEMDLPGGRQ